MRTDTGMSTDRPEPSTSLAVTARGVEWLLQSAQMAPSAAQAWRYLQAAHVEGQLIFALHGHVHVRMLGLAWRTRDWPEVAGQLWRLGLVPLGHLSGRLPVGNPGRSTVSAFAPQPVPDEINTLITLARAQASQAT